MANTLSFKSIYRLCFWFIQWIFNAQLHYFFLLDSSRKFSTSVLHINTTMTLMKLHFSTNEWKNWITWNLIKKKLKNYLKTLTRGRKFRWGVFRGARGGCLGVGRFKRGADLEHNRAPRGWVVCTKYLHPQKLHINLFEFTY